MTTLEAPALGGPISAGQDIAQQQQQQQGMSAIAQGNGAGVDDPDVWIAQLMQCKPLSEGEVKRLCDKVRRDERRMRAERGYLERSGKTSAAGKDSPSAP